MTLATKESTNGQLYVKCPNCSKMYGWTMDNGKLVEQEVPGKCRRCGCPMDEKKALEFSEEQARKHHNPALSDLGNKIRGLQHPPFDRAIKAAPTK